MTTGPSLLSEVSFGAFLQYSPRGSSEVSVRSRVWRDALKRDKPGALAKVAHALATRPEAAVLRGSSFGGDVTLVPMPRSAPLQRGGLWPGRRICEELVAAGLGREVAGCLERTRAVQKSAFAARGERPSATVHMDSLRVAPELLSPSRIVLVDDIVTKGATLLAGASLLKAAYPAANVQCFAVIRTMGLIPEVPQIVSPCVGNIRHLGGGEVQREP